MSTPGTLQLPPTVRAVRLDTPRGPLAGLEARPEGAPASAALLVPGYTGSKEDFLTVLEPLSAAGHRVLAIDQRGQLDSARADGLGYGIPVLAEDVLHVARVMGEGPVHLLGHSFGGLVARTAALTDPGAFRSLVLLSSGPASIPGQRAVGVRELLGALPHLGLAEIWAEIRRRDEAAGIAPAPPQVEAFLRHRFLRTCPRGLQQMGEQLLSEPDRVAELAALCAAGLPVRVVYGENDDAWPPRLQAEMAHRLGGDPIVVPGAGHSPAAEQPAATVAALSAFWAEVDRASASRSASN